jgi:AraC-like DNA-binding protein
VSYSSNLEELLQKGIRFYNQITDEVQISLKSEGDHVYFTTVFRRPELDLDHFYIEYWHVIWHRFASWFIGKPIKLLGSYINYTPLDKSEYDLLFRCPTYLKSKYNRLVFHRNYLHEPLIKSHRELQVFLRRAPIDLLTIPGEDSSLSARIYQLLEPKLNRGIVVPGSVELSKELSMSEQTLRRKLTAEGTSYQQIKDNLRSDMANKLLRDRSITIAKIAKQLGFSEPRAFTRAYKQWMDVTPREYRAQRLARMGFK